MTIRITRDTSGLATVLMDRPARRNAFTMEMYGAFGEALASLDADDSIRCILVRGAGATFSAGSDIGGFDESRSGREQAREFARFTLSMTDQLKNTRHPTVAAIEGACVGGGLEIAAMCDIRIAASSARFGLPINRIGLTVDHDELRDLIQVCGHSAALEILLEGHVFGAQEALAKRLVTRVVSDEEFEQSVAQTVDRILAGAPLVNRWHKKFINRLRDPRPLAAEERDEAYLCFDTHDYKAGRAAFASKERPVFTGR
jgi:enoyl-CoA hydratase